RVGLQVAALAVAAALAHSTRVVAAAAALDVALHRDALTGAARGARAAHRAARAAMRRVALRIHARTAATALRGAPCMTAAAAVGGIALQIEVFVALAVAVVVTTVAGFVRGRSRRVAREHGTVAGQAAAPAHALVRARGAGCAAHRYVVLCSIAIVV